MSWKKALTFGVLSAWIAVALCWLCDMAYASDYYIKTKVVQLSSLDGKCTGVHVVAPSGKTYLLTAGHCRRITIEDRTLIVTEDGEKVVRKVIAESPVADLMLMEPFPNKKGLPVAKNSKPGEHIRAFGRGSKPKAYVLEGSSGYPRLEYAFMGTPDTPGCGVVPKYPVDILGCFMAVFNIGTDTKIVPGSSGGPVVNDSGHVVGIVSTHGPDGGGYVPLISIQDFLHDY